MLKAMLFVDADWLCARTLEPGKPDLQIDHRRLGAVLADEIGRRHHLGPIDVVRSYYFASRLHDRDARDPSLIQRRRAFLASLQGSPPTWEVVEPASRRPAPAAMRAVRPRPRRRRCNRCAYGRGDAPCPDPGRWIWRSFCSAIAAVPLLQELRRLGRRVALVSIDGSCAADLADPANPARLRLRRPLGCTRWSAGSSGGVGGGRRPDQDSAPHR
jgi:hypothetical protein